MLHPWLQLEEATQPPRASTSSSRSRATGTHAVEHSHLGQPGPTYSSQPHPVPKAAGEVRMLLVATLACIRAGGGVAEPPPSKKEATLRHSQLFAPPSLRPCQATWGLQL